MENSDKEFCNPHLSFDNCSKEVTNMLPLTLQKPRSEKKRKKYVKTDSYVLRKRFKCDTTTEFLNKKNKVEVLYNLCKPVFVSITKLSISELKKWSKKDLSKTEVKDASTEEKSQRLRKQAFKRNVRNRQYNSVNKVKLQIRLSHKKERVKNKNLSMQNLLKSIKQPCIKLRRIDEVFNKIALSFAKATSTKECKTNAQIECVKETQTESVRKSQTESNTSLLESQELQLLSINTDGSLQNDKTKSVVTAFHVNEIPQLNECIENSSIDSADFEISKNHSKQDVRRKHDMNSSDRDRDNDSVNNVLHKISLKKTKRLRTDLSEKAIESNVVNEEHSIEEAEDLMLQVELSEGIDVPDELYKSPNRKNLNMNETVNELKQSPSTLKNMFINYDHYHDDDNDDDDNRDNSNESNNYIEDRDNDDDYDNANETVEEGNAPNYVPSELNLVCTAKDNVSMKVKNLDSMIIEKSVLENKDIQEPMQETFMSDKDFIQKYKLFKELRVFLTRFDFIQNFSNIYSATEIEQITKACTKLNTLNNQKSKKKSTNAVLSIPASLKDCNIRLQKRIESERCVLNLNSCDTSNKNIYSSARKTQIESSASLKRSSPNLTSNVKIQPEKCSEIQKVCHNLTERFENNSKERYKRRSINDSVEKLIVSTPTTESALLLSSQKRINETSELSNITEKSGDTLHPSSAIKFMDKTFPIIEKISQTSCKQISRKLFTEGKNEKLLALGKSSHLSEILKKPISITHSKIPTNKSASTCYTSIISPLKYKKPIEKNDTRSLNYKCIVCDLCFEDYSDLKSHLIIHTQKRNNILPSLSKDLNVFHKESKESILCTSETEILESSETSGQKSAEEGLSKFVTSEDNKRVKKNDVSPKNLISKEKKKKRIKSTNNSNECSICLQVFPTRTDLAAHIYLHTETELQQAYNLAKQKMNKGESMQNEDGEQIENINSTVDSIRVNETISIISDKKGYANAQNSDMSLVAASSESRVEESTALSEGNLESIEFPRKPGKEKMTKAESSKKHFTICVCHNKPGTNENCLQIEIVLLCHTCKVLFRSMQCFETHYRLPEYPVCNQKRLISGRSPNLFCATCGMIFSSIQEVRHHLDIHARFKKNWTLHFRCNICKVIFLRIGTLFYIHWSKHARDPFWIASEQSFPRHCIVNKKLRKIDNSNTSMDEYIQVGEYVCNYCKLLFVTEEDLKNHVLRCELNSVQDTAVGSSNSAAQTQPTISIICSLCNDIFTEKTEFYKHIKNKHNINNDPHFVCISLKTIKTVYICSICMAAAANLDDFEDHWLNHTVTHLCFTCTCCNKAYHNSLNLFLKHAKEHITGSSGVLSCVVTYEKAKFMCKICSIGFDTSQNLQEHCAVHKIFCPQLILKSAQLLTQNNSASATEVDRVSGHVESKESDIEKEQEKSLQHEAQETGKINKICPSRYSTDSDKEKLIRVLEGSEDDSDHELIIDLTKQSDEYNESLRGEGSKEKQTTSNITVTTNVQGPSKNVKVSDISQSVIPIVTNTSTSENVTSLMSSESTNISQDSYTNLNNVNKSSNVIDTEIEKTEEILKKLFMENTESIQNNKVQDTILTINKEEPKILETILSSKKQSPPRPRQGFLRVKTFEELSEFLQLCEFCGFSVKGDLVNHVCCDALNENDGKQQIIEKESSLIQLTNSTSEIYKGGLTPETNSNILPLHSSNANYRFVLPKKQDTQFCATPISSQQSQRLQTNRNSPSLQSVTSAYHKNLPACNIVRTTTAIPRSAVLKGDGSLPSKKVRANVANTSGIKKLASSTYSVNKNKRLNCFANVLYDKPANPTDQQYEYKCNFCDFRSKNATESLLHELPGSRATCKRYIALQPKQNPQLGNVNNLPPMNNIQPKQNPQLGNVNNLPPMNNTQSNLNLNQPTVMNQSSINYGSSPICYQYHYTAASTSDNNNQLLKQNQQIISTPSVSGNASSSIYYKNPNHSNGGMSIVINQTTPTVQNIPTVGILQQPAQQQIYQPQIYNKPITIMDTSYVQQSQNLVDYSRSGNIYQMGNTQYNVSNREPTVATYEVTLRPPAFVCSYCPKNFITHELLEVHINSDHNFTCNICNLRLYSFQDLSIHRVKHGLI